MISLYIYQYHIISVLSCNVSQREWFTNPVETSLTTWGEGWSSHLPHRVSCQPPWEPPCTDSGVFLSRLCLSSTSQFAPFFVFVVRAWVMSRKLQKASRLCSSRFPSLTQQCVTARMWAQMPILRLPLHSHTRSNGFALQRITEDSSPGRVLLTQTTASQIPASFSKSFSAPLGAIPLMHDLYLWYHMIQIWYCQ